MYGGNSGQVCKRQAILITGLFNDQYGVNFKIFFDRCVSVFFDHRYLLLFSILVLIGGSNEHYVKPKAESVLDLRSCMVV